jgi:thiol-disulfide isomerase/thioredoxin
MSFHSAQMFKDGLSFSGFERNKVFLGDGDGGFSDLSSLSGADTPNDSRGAIWADFDDDGDADIFVHNVQRERHDLYRNDIHQPGSADAHFIKIQLRATTLQYEAIGATVTVSGPWGKTSQVLSRGAGFNSCQPPELIFGLGASRKGSVDVTWPGGSTEEFGSFDADSRVMLVEGGGFELIPTKARSLPDPMPPGLKVDSGDVLSKLVFADKDGNRVVLDPAVLGADGKPIYLNLWASYCSGCVGELPLLKRMAESGEVHVVTLSMDTASAIPAAEAILDKLDAPFTRLYITERPLETSGQEVTTEDLFDLQRLAIPSTLVLNAEGRIETVIRGPIRE